MSTTYELQLPENNGNAADTNEWLLSLIDHAIQFNKLKNFSNMIRYGSHDEQLKLQAVEWKQLREKVLELTNRANGHELVMTVNCRLVIQVDNQLQEAI